MIHSWILLLTEAGGSWCCRHRLWLLISPRTRWLELINYSYPGYFDLIVVQWKEVENLHLSFSENLKIHDVGNFWLQPGHNPERIKWRKLHPFSQVVDKSWCVWGEIISLVNSSWLEKSSIYLTFCYFECVTILLLFYPAFSQWSGMVKVLHAWGVLICVTHHSNLHGKSMARQISRED